MSSSVSRPITPDSPSTKTLDDLTNTIDDLTLALNNFSRVPSPEPPSLLSCCCQREDCENLKAWQAMKLRLENRLILSAEIGQALLQRHEAYVRRHENCSVNDGHSSSSEDGVFRLTELLKEKHVLEKRLTQALVNNEVTEVSSKTLHQELQEARTMISRLSASHAKSIGWETRLSVVNRERDDMQQERDFESQRARLAESRFAALKDKTSKLRSEVRQLQDELEQKRLQRMESTESLLQNARSRIQILHTTFGSQSTSESAEVTNVLESLVNDNEGLKRDNAELQSLLAESRDDLHALQQEVEERRANMPMKSPRSLAGTPLHANFGRTHHYSGSLSSSSMREHVTPLLNRRHSSLERNGLRPLEPLTPDTLTRELPPLSPGGFDSRSTFGSRSYGPLPPSPYQIEFDGESATGLASPEKTRTHRPLFLLTRSCGVQTDHLPSNLLGLSPVPTSPAPSTSIPTPSPHDPRSETSSFSDSTTSNMGTIVERMTALFTRMSQADALTLTNRLKRQHLRGADVGHISRNTVNGIINETSTIRIQFRHLLEDEHLVTMCTRKDLRALFKLFREFFVEMGTMRVTLNDVILDPSIATRVSELALDPAKTGVEKNPNGAASSSWMAPISKLFTPSGTRADTTAGAERAVSPSTAALSSLTRAPSNWANSRPPRFVPKLQPALSASATTVNVEFSSGVGRSITSSSATPAGPSRQESVVASTDVGSSSVMGIFAGAPPSSPDPWVVVSKGPRRVQSTLYRSESPVIFRQPGLDAGLNPNFLSRNVDAVIDEQNTRLPMVDEGANGEEKDIITPLMHHKLKRRGLSDSSIHSTFTSQGDELMPSQGTSTLPLETHWPSKGSVLQALSRKVQSFRSGITDVLPSSSSYDDRRQLSGAGTGPRESGSSSRVVSKSGLSGYIPDISSWAATDSMNIADSLMAVGSPPRDESSMMRHR
ncbi:hypothetical protein F5876DRAFT_75281 [Lentinula aff. lateritia]|uniref:Uncharacterized protein n=1 Tax=Lentinula aff. lateritia TaxID=2804960 RepID=A0ACC1U4M1_9AGAR|nr:hypothetical protein F5876DRAFT_75281 [Lentinula aff. lateritia]